MYVEHLISAFLGSYFKDNADAAFASSSFWNFSSCTVVFGYSNVLCTEVKIYIMMALTLVAAISYTLAEYIVRKQGRDKSRESHTGSRTANEKEHAGCSDSLTLRDTEL